MLWPLQEAHCTFVVNTLREIHRKNFSSAPHFTPLENVDPRRQVTKLISPNNTVVGSTELARQETLNALLERMSVFQIRV